MVQHIDVLCFPLRLKFLYLSSCFPHGISEASARTSLGFRIPQRHEHCKLGHSQEGARRKPGDEAHEVTWRTGSPMKEETNGAKQSLGNRTEALVAYKQLFTGFPTGKEWDEQEELIK